MPCVWTDVEVGGRGMIELKGFKKILFNFLKRIGIIKERVISKEEMCRNAIDNNVCNRCCESCAWSGENE